MVSNNIRDKFKKLYKEQFEIDLTDEEATQMANDLVNLVRVLVKPKPKSVSVIKMQPERSQREIISLQSY